MMEFNPITLVACLYIYAYMSVMCYQSNFKYYQVKYNKMLSIELKQSKKEQTTRLKIIFTVFYRVAPHWKKSIMLNHT